MGRSEEKFRSNFSEKSVPSPLASKKLKKRYLDLKKKKQKEVKGTKVKGKKGQRTKAAIETQKETPKEDCIL